MGRRGLRRRQSKKSGQGSKGAWGSILDRKIIGAVLTTAVLLIPPALSTCPGETEMASECGGAKAASTGNCLVCVAGKSQFAGCPAEAIDSYCSGSPSPARVFGSCKDAAHSFMDCRGASSCAVLVLETGKGDGYYSHKSPSVHGLWPQSGHYGNSACVIPKSSTTVPGFLPRCYDNEESKADLPHQLTFVQHEWEKHGACSGATDEAGYFDNICALARQGTELMDNSKPLQSIANTLHNAGLPVYCVDTSSSQIYISACASRNGGNHRILSEQQQPSCDAKTLHQVTDEVNAQCCGADDTACANGMPTSWYVGLYMFLSRPPCVPDFVALHFC